MVYSIRILFQAIVLSIFSTTVLPVWADGPSAEAVRCASILAGTQVAESQRLIDAMNWQGPVVGSRNFFFDEDRFAQAKVVLRSYGPANDIALWSALNVAGFNSLITVTSPDGQQVLARGRLDSSQIRAAFVDDDIVIERVFLFTEVGRVQLLTKDISSRAQVSIENVPFELPSHLQRLRNNSDLASNVGIPFLRRSAGFDNIVENIRSGRITPVPQEVRVGTHWNNTIYLSFGKDTDQSYFETYNGQALSVKREPFVLIFSNELLNRADFWINQGWDRGQFDSASIYVNHPNFRKALYLHSHSIWGSYSPEIVFADDISLDSLKAIYVRFGARNRILQKLKEELSPDRFEVVESLITEHE